MDIFLTNTGQLDCRQPDKLLDARHRLLSDMKNSNELSFIEVQDYLKDYATILNNKGFSSNFVNCIDRLSFSDEKDLVAVLGNECLTYLDKHTLAHIHGEVYTSPDPAGKFFEMITQTKISSHLPYLMTNCIAFSDGSNSWCDTSHAKFKATNSVKAEVEIQDMFSACTSNSTQAKIYLDKSKFECSPYDKEVKTEGISDYAKLIYAQYHSFSSDDVTIQHAALHIPDIGFVSKCGGSDLLLHEALDLANAHNTSTNNTYLHSIYGDPLYLCQFTSENVTDHSNDLNKVFCDTFPKYESCSSSSWWWDYFTSSEVVGVVAGITTGFALGFAMEYWLDWGHHHLDHHLHIE